MMSPRSKLRLGILISGRGSNMLKIAEACADPEYPAEVCCVISDRQTAMGLEDAKRLGIPTYTVESKPLDEDEIDRILRKHKVKLVCLAGFMRIISPKLLSRWRIINIHPSLLPDFKGLNAQRQALMAGVKFTGCTVHYVVPEVDAGPIICRGTVQVLPNDTEQSLSDRILAMEHVCYPSVIEYIAEKKRHKWRERPYFIEIDNHKISLRFVLISAWRALCKLQEYSSANRVIPAVSIVEGSLPSNRKCKGCYDTKRINLFTAKPIVRHRPPKFKKAI